MKILVIEDDINLSGIIAKALKKERFQVDVANFGLEGEELAYVNNYDAILLDLNLPDKDGIEILKFLRDENILTPIIIVTARDETKQRALGLDYGADDYLVKPFDFLELVARIRAVTRRFQGRANPSIEIDGIIFIEPKTKVVKINNSEVILSIKEYDILELLAIQHPQIVTNEAIAEQLYGDEYDSYSSVLRVHIANLRKKLRIVYKTEVIQTVKGRGYRICLKDET